MVLCGEAGRRGEGVVGEGGRERGRDAKEAEQGMRREAVSNTVVGGRERASEASESERGSCGGRERECSSGGLAGERERHSCVLVAVLLCWPQREGLL